MNPKIIIGCPYRNRDFVLERYFKHLSEIEYDNKEYVFLLNDDLNSNTGLVKRFLGDEKVKVYKHISKGNIPSETRKEYNRNGYEHLAYIRNLFLEKFLKTDGEYLLSIDSDILVPSNIVKQLLYYANQYTIVGAAISNIENKPMDGHVPTNFMHYIGDNLTHFSDYPMHGVLDVDLTGAVYLIPRGLIEQGCRYGADRQGEDIPFCRYAKKHGYKILVNLDCKPEHIMSKEK